MKSLKKLLFLAVMCFSLLFVACGKPSEEELTQYLNAEIQSLAGFEYEYGDISKLGSKEDYDKHLKFVKDGIYQDFSDFGIPITPAHKDKLYNTVLARGQSFQYEIKCDEITNNTANFTIISQAWDETRFSQLFDEKCKLYSSNTANYEKSEDDMYDDLINIFIECFNESPNKEIITKATLKVRDNAWRLETPLDDLLKVFSVKS